MTVLLSSFFLAYRALPGEGASLAWVGSREGRDGGPPHRHKRRGSGNTRLTPQSQTLLDRCSRGHPVPLTASGKTVSARMGEELVMGLALLFQGRPRAQVVIVSLLFHFISQKNKSFISHCFI